MQERNCRQCGADLQGCHWRAVLCGAIECKKLERNAKAREAYAKGGAYKDRALRKRGVCSVCAKPTHTGSGSLAKPTCRECRARISGRVAFPKAPKSCADCGVDCIRKPSRYDGKRYCLNCAKVRTVRRDVEKRRARRAVRQNLPRERYTLAEVQELSCHVCGICGGLVDPTLSGLDEYGPTVDHIIPIAKGGPDLRHNVQLAHRVCNLRKGARI